MNTATLFSQRFLAGVEQIKQEIQSFSSEEDLWKTPGTISNSPGNLTLHLIGNLNHFIGAQLGNTGYVRNREKEFSDKNIPREWMLTELDKAAAVVSQSLDSLSDDDLLKTYPLEIFGPGKSTIGVLIILIGHFNYHLGQINYLRRMI